MFDSVSIRQKPGREGSGFSAPNGFYIPPDQINAQGNQGHAGHDGRAEQANARRLPEFAGLQQHRGKIQAEPQKNSAATENGDEDAMVFDHEFMFGALPVGSRCPAETRLDKR
jgi:hypothetical protein